MRLISLLLAAAVAAAVVPVQAQAPANAEASQKEAAAKFKQGLALFDQGKANEALPLFSEAVAVTKSPNARLMLARCHRELRQIVQAYQELELVIKDALAAADPKYEKTMAAAQTELSELESTVAKLTLTLAEAPPGLELRVDEHKLKVEDLGEPLVVTPGEHSILATAEGYEPIVQQVTLAGGANETVELSLLPEATKAEPAPQSVAEPTPPPAKPTPKSTMDLRTVGYVAAGVGVAGLGVFATTGLMARSKYNTVNDACGGSRCEDTKYVDEIDSGKQLQTIANVGLVVGAAGIVTGAALILAGGGPSEAEGASVAAAALPHGGYVGYQSRF